MTAGASRSWPIVERGRGPSVVLLHGYPLDHRMWSRQLDPIGERWRCVLLDLPGFGAAEDRPTPDTLAGFSDTVAKVITHQLNPPVSIVGHSFGGYVALQLIRDHPQLLSALVLANTRSEPDSPEAREKRMATVRRSEATGEGIDVEATTRALLRPSSAGGDRGVVAEVQSMVRAARPVAIRGALTAIAQRSDLTGTLAAIQVPSLVIWGEQDQLIPAERTRAMLAHLPNATGAGIPGAGHLPSMEAPALFNRAIVEFLRRLPGNAG